MYVDQISQMNIYRDDIISIIRSSICYLANLWRFMCLGWRFGHHASVFAAVGKWVSRKGHSRRLSEGPPRCGFGNILPMLGDDELKPSLAAIAYKARKLADFMRPLISHNDSPMIYG
jgi:hypothetical protein